MKLTDYFAPLHPADIRFDKDNVPESTQYHDVYFSRAGGYDETMHVFINGNQLPQRFADADQEFTIIETGFGTGLNFLVAVQQFLKHAPKSAKLYYWSVEKHPLTREDLKKALGHFETLPTHDLIQNYPPLAVGVHRRWLYDDRICLNLLWGDVQAQFSQIHTQADAWFLDGFAPAENPDMWSDDLWPQIKRLSKPDASVATFTAAAKVRRGLESVGVQVEKMKGFGKKRDMLIGRLVGELAAVPVKKIAVIGAGIAGCHTAYSLARRGYDVTVYDAADTVAAGASSNTVGGFYPRLTADLTIPGQFYQAAFSYAVHHYHPFEQMGLAGLCGVYRAALNDQQKKRYQKILALDQTTPDICQGASVKDLFGLPTTDMLLHEQGGWVNPQGVCAELLMRLNIPVQLGCKIADVKQDKAWQLLDDKGQIIAVVDAVVLATAGQTFGLVDLPLETVRGQVVYVKADANSSQLQQVVCHDGYISPAIDGVHCIGSSYERGSDQLVTKQEDTVDILQRVQQNLPDLFAAPPQVVCEWVGVRVAAKDRLPIIGAVNGYDGLYINTAHGSYGITSSPLAGEWIADAIGGAASVDILQQGLSPNRFNR